MKIISVKGVEFLVDDDDYEKLKEFNWHISKQGYATRSGKFMHNYIMGEKPGMVVDHKNQNVRDNRRANLRFATISQNIINRRMHSNNKSGYRGVSWSTVTMKWRAHIQYEYKYFSLGYFDDPKEAARVYNEAALKHHGEFAVTNPIERLG